MAMDRRRLVLIAILVVSVGLTLYTSPLTKGLFQRKPPAARPPAQASQPAQASPAREPVPPLSRDALVAWRQRYGEAWSRDPFFTAEEEQALRAPRVVTALTAPAQPLAPLPAYKVKAVLISGSDKIAAIDGRLVSEGEMLGEERVVEIQPDGVILERAGQRRRVEIVGGAVPLIEVGPGPPRGSDRR